jgi:hypothetical protein
MLRRKPRAEESFDAGRSSIARWRTSVSAINLRSLHWHGQSTQRSRPGNGRRYLEFRLSITFDWLRYSRRFFSSATPSAWSLRARHSRSRVGSKPYLRFASVPIEFRFATCRVSSSVPPHRSPSPGRRAEAPPFRSSSLRSSRSWSVSRRRGLSGAILGGSASLFVLDFRWWVASALSGG